MMKCTHPDHVDGCSCEAYAVACDKDCECCMGKLKYTLKVTTTPPNNIKMLKELRSLDICDLEDFDSARNFLLGRTLLILEDVEKYNKVVEIVGGKYLELTDCQNRDEWHASKYKTCMIDLTLEQLNAQTYFNSLSKEQQDMIFTYMGILGYGPAPVAMA